MSEAIISAAPAANGSKLKAFGIYSGYTAFFVIALVMSLVWTFPNRQLKTFIEGQARTHGVPVSIGEMELRGIGGVTLRKLHIVLPAPKAAPARGKAPAAKPAEPTIIRLDELRADIGILAALSGRYEVDFELAVGDGTLEDGRVVVTKGGSVIDVEIENIDELPLGALGVGRRIVAAAPKLSGELDGDLNGSVKIHWGGLDDFTGRVDLELRNAVIRKPELALEGGLKLADLRMGALTLNVRIDKKRKIKVLSGRKGSEKATAISLEGVDMFGKDIELVVEERSHVLIPPGKAGMRTASMWVHFAFALPEAKPPTNKEGEGGEEDGGEAVGGERLKWSQVMKFAGSKLKPFARNGYIGMTCSGLLKRPSCKPALPQVTVGTRRKARTEARKNKKDPKASEAPAEVAKPAPEAAPKPEDKPAAKPTAPARPTGLTPDKIVAKPVPRPAAVDKKIVPRKQDTPKKDKDDEDEDEEEEDEEEEEEEEEEDEEEEDDEDDEDEDAEGRGAKKRPAAGGKGAKVGAKKAGGAAAKKDRRARDEEEEEEEEE